MAQEVEDWTLLELFQEVALRRAAACRLVLVYRKRDRLTILLRCVASI